MSKVLVVTVTKSATDINSNVVEGAIVEDCCCNNVVVVAVETVVALEMEVFVVSVDIGVTVIPLSTSLSQCPQVCLQTMARYSSYSRLHKFCACQ